MLTSGDVPPSPSAADTSHSLVVSAALRGARVTRVARAVTEMLAPAVVVAIMLTLLGWYSTDFQIIGLFHGAIAAIFESVLPFAYIMKGVRSGKLTDHHIRQRQQRRGPLFVALFFALVGLAILIACEASQHLIAGVVAGGVGLVVAIVISHWWKMSIHAAVASGSVVIVGMMTHNLVIILVSIPVVVVVGWSRIRLHDHTLAQVIVGIVVGAFVAVTIFGSLT